MESDVHSKTFCVIKTLYSKKLIREPLPRVKSYSMTLQLSTLRRTYGGNYSQERATNDQVTASRRLHWRHDGKWLSLTPNPPRIPVLYTLAKIHKPTPVGRPTISGCDGPTERISAFDNHLLQPIAKVQPSDTTDSINFIEKTKLPPNTTLVSMDVTSLYTNIPQEEGISTVCEAYEEFYQGNPPTPTRF